MVISEEDLTVVQRLRSRSRSANAAGLSGKLSTAAALRWPTSSEFAVTPGPAIDRSVPFEIRSISMLCSPLRLTLHSK
jgi:hypothetical protein